MRGVRVRVFKILLQRIRTGAAKRKYDICPSAMNIGIRFHSWERSVSFELGRLRIQFAIRTAGFIAAVELNTPSYEL